MKKGEEYKDTKPRELQNLRLISWNKHYLREIWTHDIRSTPPPRCLNQYDSAPCSPGAYSLHHEFVLRFSQRFIWLFAKLQSEEPSSVSSHWLSSINGIGCCQCKNCWHLSSACVCYLTFSENTPWLWDSAHGTQRWLIDPYFAE